MSSLTAPSSAEIIPFQPTPPKGFDAYREFWSRQVLADTGLSHRSKSVATALIWYLNRSTLNCWPSYDRLATDAGIHRSDAMKAVKELVNRGYLILQSKGGGRKRSNHYSLAKTEAIRHRLGRETVAETVAKPGSKRWQKQGQNGGNKAESGFCSEVPSEVL
jgi:biotin operon repressor